MSHSKRYSNECGSHNAQKNWTLDFSGMKHSHNNQPGQRNQSAAHESQVSPFYFPLGKVHQAYKGGWIWNHNACIFQTDDSNKQSDSRGDGCLYRIRYGPYNCLTQSDGCYHDEKYTWDEHNHQSLAICVAHSQHNRICKKCVQSHSGRLSKGHSGIQSAEDCSDKSSNTRSDKYSVCNFPCHGSISHDDVGVC